MSDLLFYSITVELIDNIVAAGPDTSNGFFQAYFLSILENCFYILTDADHKSGFKSTSITLARLFKLVESGDIQAPLYDPSAMQDPSMNNSKFVATYCADLLKRAFPHLQQTQIVSLITALREQNNDPIKVKTTLRDFLSQSAGRAWYPSQERN